MPQSFNWSILLDHGRDLFIFKPSFPGITNAGEKSTFEDKPKGPSAPAAIQPGQMCSRPIEPVQRSTIESCTHGSCMKSKKRLTSWWFMFHRPTKAAGSPRHHGCLSEAAIDWALTWSSLKKNCNQTRSNEISEKLLQRINFNWEKISNLIKMKNILIAKRRSRIYFTNPKTFNAPRA